MHWVERWSVRKIASHLRIGRRTIAKYLDVPAPPKTRRERTSKLDPFKAAIAELLQQDPTANAPVIAQRLQPLGYSVITIIKDYLRASAELRGAPCLRAHGAMEPAAGERFDIDWGHFGALVYNGPRGSFTPSAWSSATAAECTWSLLTAKALRVSCVAICTPFRR